MGLRCRVVFFLFGYLSFFKVIFRRPLLCDAFRRSLGLFDATAEKDGSIQIVGKQIVFGFPVVRVKRDGLFKTLSRFGSMGSCGQPATGFRAPSPGAAEPKFVFGVRWRDGEGLFKEFGGLFVIAVHEVILAGEQVACGIGGRILLENVEGARVIGSLVEGAGTADYVGRSRSRDNQQQKAA